MATYSSALLRERDQKLVERFDKERAEYERKIRKIKHGADETAKDLFDAVNRGNRLARSLGFENMYVAQVAIDSADFDISFRDCFSRVQLLEAQLNSEKKEVEILQARLLNADGAQRWQDDVERLKAELRECKSRHHAEKQQLNERYDSLKDVKERAAERYKADFKKWREFKTWLFAEDDEHRKHRNEAGISKEEKKKRDIAAVMRRREMMQELGPDLSQYDGEPDHPPPMGGIDMEADKENGGTPVPSPKKRPTSSRETLLKSVTNTTAPSSSPNVFFNSTPTNSSTRAALVFHPIPDTTQIKREPTSTPSPMRSFSHRPSSSDTEDDSQAVCVPSTNPRSGKPAVFKVPAPPPTLGMSPRRGLSSSLPSRPSFTKDDRRKLNLSVAEPMRQEERPSKVRKLVGDEFARPERSSTPSTSQSHRHAPLTATKGKDKERENATVPGDYSVFKGRGRYGPTTQAEDKTINALYTIDPTVNGGRSYQYDEVVRSRDDRRRMDAGDCECCREYYQSIGPLPSRLQQPLWGSPPATPAKPCPRHSHSPQSERRHPGSAAGPSTTDIESHKKAISRHRHTWARAGTPPGYWDIGFPSTQEVGNINEKAKEMQKRKKDDVDKEARSEGGRYRRRRDDN